MRKGCRVNISEDAKRFLYQFRHAAAIEVAYGFAAFSMADQYRRPRRAASYFPLVAKTIDAKWQIDHIARHAHPGPMPDPAGQGAILCRHDLEFDLESKLFQCKTM
ncbi:hypothetical protein [Burkholderia pseudomallei]|uniref:hypothetical protein n=1 Tax=Burkholderia pseudomallei TaxID=28450 RepID=UPI001E39E5C8|nr:hypothetical protein [Burkholderia pseudomallei]